jgi:hypothetical protein
MLTRLQEFHLMGDGVQLFRNAIDPVSVIYLKQAADFAYSLVEQARSLGDLAPDDIARHVAETTFQWGGIPISTYLSIASSQFPQGSDVFAKVSEEACGLVRSASASPFVEYRPDLSYLRRHVGSATHVGWHYDAHAAGSIVHDPVYNAWVPFVPVGSQCPTLEFLPKSNSLMKSDDYERTVAGFPSGSWLAPRMDDDSAGAALRFLRRILGDRSSSPGFRKVGFDMKPGDMVIFDHWTLHRTQPIAAEGVVRTSAEVRITTRKPDRSAQ